MLLLNKNGQCKVTGNKSEIQKLQWHCSAVSGLAAQQLLSMLTLRQQVFIVEQQCLYADIDNLDAQAVHLLAMLPENGEVVACARLIAPGMAGVEPRIGRFVVAQHWRGKALGHALLQRALHWLDSHYPQQAIVISAQLYLEKFYQQAGFVSESAPYDEDGIAHIAMRRPAVKA